METAVVQDNELNPHVLPPSIATLAVVPLISLPSQTIKDYFQALVDYDLLKERLCNIIDPSWSTVKILLERYGQQIYFVVDPAQDCKILGEFLLESFIGKAAQIHFSVHPENNFSFSLEMCRYTMDRVLNKWSCRGNKDEPYLLTLYGLTPVTNRAACIFVLRAGMKKVGILPNSINYKGAVVDSMVTTRVRKQ